MVKARKERRWARVAAAVALCLPCSSFVTPLYAADAAQIKNIPASLPPMRTQSELNRASQTQPVARARSQNAAPATSLPSMRTQSQYASTSKAVPTRAFSAPQPERYATAQQATSANVEAAKHGG